MQQPNNAIILDTETAKLNGNAIEIAYFPMTLSNGIACFQPSQAYCERFNPMQPIELEAMAVHHIFDDEVQDMSPHTAFKLPSDVKYIIGHNIDYDIRVLKRAGLSEDIKPIDTLCLARRYFPEANSHSLSVLSYFLASDKRKVRDILKNAHNALTDITLTAALLNHIINRIDKQHTQSLEDLFQHSLECRVPTHMPFGEHKNKRINLMPDSYKQWLLRKSDLDHFLKLALLLDQADHWRRSFEASENFKPGTFSAYQFINSRTPTDLTKNQVLDLTLQYNLDINYDL